jgi:4'-phosphopantetheinyl transferase
VIWLPAPAIFELSAGEICVWRADLECGADLIAEYRTSLSIDEQRRADRFRFSKDRNRYIVARGVLRRLLSAYTGRQPSDFKFEYGPQGKPLLMKEPALGIHFNLSHSQAVAVYALSRARDLGIDVEEIRPGVATTQIAKRYFSPNEMNEMLGLSSDLREEAFFLCWTRKEAYIKALGEGLKVRLDSFDVSLTPGEQARFLRGVEQGWQLVSFTASERQPAALVFNGGPAEVRYYNFSATCSTPSPSAPKR